MNAEGTLTIPKHVFVFTAGVGALHPGPGGYGVVLSFGEHFKELSGGFQRTTDDRMPLLWGVGGTMVV